jgi:ABC-type Fe3+-siderophore transport system permease subunit
MISWKNIRDVILFFAGLIGVSISTAAWLYGRTPEPTLLVTFTAMMGLPAFLRSDEKTGKS